MDEEDKKFSSVELVQITDAQISANFNSVPEAKLAIKQLKLKKKEFALAKKNVINEQKRIRAEYTNEVRTRGSMLKGGGVINKFARGVQSIARDSRKMKLANDLEPLEKQKQRIDIILSSIDSVLLQTEAYILKQQSNSNQ